MEQSRKRVQVRRGLVIVISGHMTSDQASSTLPGGYVRELLDLCARFDVAPGEVLDGLALPLETLTDPATRVPLPTFAQIVRRAERLTGEPGLAYLAGMHMRASWHGYVGFAAMTAGTIGEALELAERFGRTRTDAISLVTRTHGDQASILIEEHVPLGELREFLVMALLLGVVTIGDSLVGRRLSGALEVTHAAPPYFHRLLSAAPSLANLRFEQAANRLVFPAEALKLPLLTADPAATKLVREQCERELAALGEGARLVGRVRALLRDAAYPTLEDAAKRLSVSSRTLKRRLAEQGTSFSELLDDARRQQALLLLEDRRLTLDAIADRLGYSDTANFTRAFKRWTGRPPGEARGGAAKRGRG